MMFISVSPTKMQESLPDVLPGLCCLGDVPPLPGSVDHHQDEGPGRGDGLRDVTRDIEDISGLHAAPSKSSTRLYDFCRVSGPP